MALTTVELHILHHLLGEIGKAKPRLLFLGYPDLLCTEASATTARLPLDWSHLPKRDEASAIWRAHNRECIDSPMLETKAVFGDWRAETTVIDAISSGLEDYVLDLNEQLSLRQRYKLGCFDLIVDPGTLEHCFNIAQAFANIASLLATGGFVYHNAAIAFPNHGFWSISPTAFFDYYEAMGFELGTPHRTCGALDSNGLLPRLKVIDPFEMVVGESHLPLIGYYAFRRNRSEPLHGIWRAKRRSAKYPIQRIYTSRMRNIRTTNFLGACLSSEFIVA
jgi:hypothetical protein